jgi:hypothetical protein
MHRRTVQLNIRCQRDVADALREEGDRRNMSLGSTLAALLTVARAGRESGIWLALPRETETALKAVAAARGREPGTLLSELLAGQLRRDLMTLAAALPTPAAQPEPTPSATSTASLEGEPDEDDDVGVFTVFD